MRNNFLLLTAMYIILIVSMNCTERRYVENINNEFITLKLIDQKKFIYFHYKSNLTNGIIHTYSKGHYSKSGKYYTLYPDSINPNEFEAHTSQQNKPNIGKNVELIVETDITDGSLDLKKYKITVFNHSFKFMINGIKIDTILKNVRLDNFRIKVDLRKDYLTMAPIPTFTSIVTRNISVVNSSNSISIKIPISTEMFYYKYQKQINIEDAGKYYILDDNKILKNESYPIK